MTRTIRLTLAYDGTDFAGWQRQPKDRSVQATLEDALSKMHGHPVDAVGAGRTDSGVHAAGQVAHFQTDIRSIPGGRFRLALNKLLPRDVRVIDSAEAHPDFHARYDARLRRYRYFIACGPECPPHRARFAWHLRKRPDVRVLDSMASSLVGETDFTVFSSARDVSSNRWRFVHSASWRWDCDSLVFEIAANAFIWRMVRSLVGSMIGYEAKGGKGEYMREALRSGDRSIAGATAPAHGLFLWNVEYYAEPTCRGKPRRTATAAIADGGPPGEDSDSPGPRLVPGYGLVDGWTGDRFAPVRGAAYDAKSGPRRDVRKGSSA